MKKALILSLIIVTLVLGGWRSSPFVLLKFARIDNRAFFLEPIRTTPLFFKDAIYVTSGKKMGMIEGQMVKVESLGGFSSVSPVRWNGAIYFFNDGGKIKKFFDEKITSATLNGKPVSLEDKPIGDPIICKGHIFIEGVKGIYRFTPDKELSSITSEPVDKLYWGNVRPVCYGDTLYALVSDGIIKIDPENFVIEKKLTLPLRSKEVTGDQVYGLAFPLLTVGSNELVIVTPSGMWGIDPGTLRERWMKKGLFIESAGADKSGILITSSGKVTYMDPEGNEIWSMPVSSRETFLAPPTYMGRGYYVTGDDRSLIIFSHEEGKIYNYYVGSGVAGQPLIFPKDGSWEISFLTRAGNFYSIRFDP